MAFLLLMYEKMRLQRKVNKLTVRQMSLGRKQDRIEKNIERVQKMYSKRESSLEKQAKIMQNNASMFYKNICGIGTQSFAWGNNYASTSMAAQQYLAGIQGTQLGFSSDKSYQDALAAYYGGTLGSSKDGSQPAGDTSGKTTWITSAQYTELQQAITQANSYVQMQSSYASTMSNQYENNVSIWLEAAKEQLEAEQDEALMDLEAEQTDIELDLSSCETQLETARARLESVKSACSQEAKDSAPKFGLG